MKRKSAYSTMKTHELARITRERGLKKPDVMSRSEWADFLEADDAKRLKEGVVEGDGKGRKLPELTLENANDEKTFDPDDSDTGTKDAPETDTSVNTSAKRKAKSDAKS